MGKTRAAITAVGGYVPEYRLTNDELATLVDTSDEWITPRTGIKERRILKGDKGTSFMCIEVAREILSKSGVDPLEIDMVMVTTVTPDYNVANTAAAVAAAIGAKKAFAFDMNAACSGFMYGLSVATAYVETGRYRKIMLIGADKMSSIVDYTDRTTCIIFGDGAAGVLVEPNEQGYGLQDESLRSDGNGRDYLKVEAGGSINPPSLEHLEKRSFFIKQDGPTVFKYAVSNMTQISEEVLTRNHFTAEDVDWVLAHQANLRIITSVAGYLGVPMEKVLINIDRYGNTTNATIPLLLWDYEQRFRKGDRLLLTAFGGGFTWGAQYLTWAYDPQPKR